MIIKSEFNDSRLVNFGSEIIGKFQKVINVKDELLISHMREDLMSGASSTTLRRRSGNLANSLRIIKTVYDASRNAIVGGITIGTIYGRMLINKRGTRTEIKPVKKQYLTIPLPDAMQGGDPNGIPRGPAGPVEFTVGPKGGRIAHTSLWGKTRIFNSRAGNLIIWGIPTQQKGQHAGEAIKQRSGVVKNMRTGKWSYENAPQYLALFKLVKSVTVDAKIAVEDLFDWVTPEITEGFKQELSTNGQP